MSVTDEMANDPRAYLSTLRGRILKLHKALIQSERRRYERMHGRIESEYQLLALLSNDPAFAWLRPLTVYIVELEEKLDDKEGLGEQDAEQFGTALRRLMMGGDRIPTFHRSYVRVLQDEPEIVLIHGEIMPTLPKPQSAGEPASDLPPADGSGVTDE
jgi:hypothetical protein